MPLGLPRRRQLGFCMQELRLLYCAGVRLTKLSLNFISGCAELFDRSAHPTGKLRQFLRAEQK